jgi:hypothetical protein
MFCHLLSGDKIDYGYWDIVLEDFSYSIQIYEKNTAIVSTKLFAKDGSSIEVIVLLNGIFDYF